MGKKKIAVLLVLGVAIATTLVLALDVTAQAQGYGSSGTSTGAKTGGELVWFALAGAALVGSGYFLTRKSRA